jgi:hypothetical protein
MVDKEPFSDLRPGMDLDARDKASEVGEDARNDGHAHHPEAMRRAMDHDGVESWVSKHNLEPVPSSGVALEHRAKIGAKGIKHAVGHPMQRVHNADCPNPIGPGSGNKPLDEVG